MRGQALCALFVLMSGCGGSSGGDRCQSNADCPTGQYCGSNGACTFDCKTNSDCPGGTCSSLGKCVGTVPPDGGLPDVSPAPDSAHPVPDVQGLPDTKLSDVNSPQDMLAAPDTSILDGPLPGDAPTMSDGPVLSEGAPKPDSPQIVQCDPAFLGRMCGFKACATNADCTGIGTGLCTQGFCEDAPCGVSNSCLTLGEDTNGDTWGVCTCTCTPDDPNTPLVIEDTCPDLTKHRCSRAITISSGTCQSNADCVQFGGGFTCVGGKCTGARSYCIKFCDPKLGQNTCDGKLSCDLRSGASIFGIHDKAVCAGKGCKADTDCPVDVGTTCSPKNPASCPTGQTCSVLDVRGDGCTADTDCDLNYVCHDFGGGAKYCSYKDGRCAAPGKCDVASGLCDVKPASLSNPASEVGSPCQSDKDCPANADCLFELDFSTIMKKAWSPCADSSECCSGACTGGYCAMGEPCTTSYRNGYCTIIGCAFASTLPIRGCDTNSVCNTWYTSGMCQRKCDLNNAATCRGNPYDLLGDYECRAFDNIQFSGSAGPIAPSPTCDFGTAMNCSVFANSALNCTSFGDQSNTANPNPTNMGCRGLNNQTKANQYDVTGWCLDDTPSGTQIRSPLPTP